LRSLTSSTAWEIRPDKTVFSPQLKTAAEGVGIVACSTMRRESFELDDIAPADHCIVGL
jgi:hypothetical protein